MKQSKQIAALQRQIANFRISKSRKRKRPVKNGVSARGPVDPIVTSVRAIMKPFDVEKGVASPLDDGRPAQKFMAKAQAQVVLTASQVLAFMYCPCAANDAVRPSLVMCVGAATNGKFTTAGSFANGTGTTGISSGTLSYLSTNTPYTSSVISDQGLEYASVGAGIKFTYEGAELYRGGTFRYVYDREGSFNNDDELWTSANIGTNVLIDYINSQANTIRQSINKDNVVEINASMEESIYRETNDPLKVYCGADAGGNSNLIGGSSSTVTFAYKPSVIGYYVNTSGQSISFHVDLVEHWAMSSPTIQALQSNSYAHAPLATHVASAMASVRQAHASQPNTHHIDVAKTTVRALQSPIGHALLNDAMMAALA